MFFEVEKELTLIRLPEVQKRIRACLHGAFAK